MRLRNMAVSQKKGLKKIEQCYGAEVSDWGVKGSKTGEGNVTLIRGGGKVHEKKKGRSIHMYCKGRVAQADEGDPVAL